MTLRNISLNLEIGQTILVGQNNEIYIYCAKIKLSDKQNIKSIELASGVSSQTSLVTRLSCVYILP